MNFIKTNITYHFILTISGTPKANKDPQFTKNVDSSVKASYDTQNAVRNDLKTNPGNHPRGINRLSSKCLIKQDMNFNIHIILLQWLLTFYRVRLLQLLLIRIVINRVMILG